MVKVSATCDQVCEVTNCRSKMCLAEGLENVSTSGGSKESMLAEWLANVSTSGGSKESMLVSMLAEWLEIVLAEGLENVSQQKLWMSDSKSNHNKHRRLQPCSS